MTGTGKAITRTPLSEHKLPTILPGVVFGTMSPYLKTENTHKNISTKIGAVQSSRKKVPPASQWYIYLQHLNNTQYILFYKLYDCKSVFLQRKNPEPVFMKLR